MMNLVPARFHRQLDNLWRNFNEPFFSELTKAFEDQPTRELATLSPPIDVEETDQAYIVRAEMPGLDKDEFSVDFRNDHLILRGEKKREKKEEKKYYRWVECSYGSFERAIYIPGDVDTEKIDAEYKNGVLEIHLPKAATSQAKEIPIKFN